MSLAIAINIGSPNGSCERVSATIDSVMENVGIDEYRFVIGMAPYINQDIKDFLYAKQKAYPDKFDIMPEDDYPWADFINEAIDRSSDCTYFIKAHDDIELLTPGFYPKVVETLKHITEPIGWISFLDKDYLNGHWAPSTRPGFHSDYLYEKGWPRKKMFQFHSLAEGWWKASPLIHGVYVLDYHLRYRLGLPFREIPRRSPEYYANLPYDIPSAPVKCHAPYNHFVMIAMDKLKAIGKCEKWSHLSLLVDEDWGLRALRLNLFNILMPDIEYIHYRPFGGTRANSYIMDIQKKTHEQFMAKWGFDASDINADLDFIKREYGNTNITWSIGKTSFEWDYLS